MTAFITYVALNLLSPGFSSLSCKESNDFSGVRINKAVLAICATASVLLCENGQTFEAEARATIRTDHLVTLRALLCLEVKVLFGNCHLTLRALSRPSCLHPLLQAILVLALSTSARLGRMLLTSEPIVERLNTAQPARLLIAHRTSIIST